MLTIAEKLAELTGARLFHNHLTFNAITPVFEFDTPPFTEVLHAYASTSSRRLLAPATHDASPLHPDDLVSTAPS